MKINKEKIVKDTIKGKNYTEELLVTLLGKAIVDVFKLKDEVRKLRIWRVVLLGLIIGESLIHLIKWLV